MIPAIYMVTTAMHHYARGVAYAALKDSVEADRERALFQQAVAASPGTVNSSTTSRTPCWGWPRAMLDGELEYHRGNHDAAYEHLRESRAPRRQPQLHRALGLDASTAARAGGAAVGAGSLRRSRSSLSRRSWPERAGPALRPAPDNVWALHGLVECLQARGETEGAAGARTEACHGLTKVDVPITSSCMCRTRIHQPAECCSQA